MVLRVNSSASESNNSQNGFHRELAAEGITVRIRWFGLCVGYLLANWLNEPANPAALNAILTLGVLYTLVDTWWSVQRRVFLSEWPLLVSAMEAVFIGLLCHFDSGPDSLFRFYYFLSILVCAVRYSRMTTFATFILHTVSVMALSLLNSDGLAAVGSQPLLLVVLLGWVAWASTSLTGLIKRASRQLQDLNSKLTDNQALLERRINARTRELQESQALLVQQEKQAAFGLLAAGIAHEVGNPLAAISSLVQMLRRQLSDDYSSQRLRMVDEQLARIQRTLRELVDFSRPATSEPSLASVHEVIDAALNIAKYYKRKKGKRVVTQYTSDMPRIRLVRDQLVQVFLNLILNAMDATKEGESIEIATQYDGQTVTVSVRDTGSGIAADDAARIFEPYFTTKSTGTGLGLFVSRRILEESGRGRIELADTSGSGTTFRVHLPCEPPGGSAVPTTENSNQDDAPQSASPATSEALPHSQQELPAP